MSKERAHSAYRSAETLKKMSDRVIGFGPFGVGLDGLLTWIPGAGLLYSAAASMFLLWSAVRSGATFSTLAKMAGLLGVDMLLSDVPVVGDVADVLWQGHLMAATTMQKDIEDRHGVPEGMDSVLHRPRRRWTGLGLLATIIFGGLIYAAWISDFRDLFKHGMGYAIVNASLPVGGQAVALWLILSAGLVVLFLLSLLRARLQKRAA
jgi:hypothetical protein